MSEKFNDCSCLDAQKLEDECYRKTKKAFEILEDYGYKWDNEENEWLSRRYQNIKRIQKENPKIGACELAFRADEPNLKDLSHAMGYGQGSKIYSGD